MINEIRIRRQPGVSVASRENVPAYWLLLLILTGLLLTAPVSATARQAEKLDLTIQYLITYVKESDVTFERNFFRHDPVAAASHIERKYQHFKDRIDSPEEFIELCATASLVTGKQYLIVDRQGDEIPAGEWLNTELARYRLQNAEQ